MQPGVVKEWLHSLGDYYDGLWLGDQMIMLMAMGSASRVVISMSLVIATDAYLCTNCADEPTRLKER